MRSRRLLAGTLTVFAILLIAWVVRATLHPKFTDEVAAIGPPAVDSDIHGRQPESDKAQGESRQEVETPDLPAGDGVPGATDDGLLGSLTLLWAHSLDVINEGSWKLTSQRSLNSMIIELGGAATQPLSIAPGLWEIERIGIGDSAEAAYGRVAIAPLTANVVLVGRREPLTVVVLDMDGVPIPGASVLVRQGGSGETWGIRALAAYHPWALESTVKLTDESGRAKFASLLPGRAFISTSCDGWVPVASAAFHDGHTKEVSVRLARTDELAIPIEVYDEVSGRPIAGAVLEADHSPIGRPTGSDGITRVQPTLLDVPGLVVSASGFAPVHVSRTALRSVPSRIALRRLVSVSVTLPFDFHGAADVAWSIAEKDRLSDVRAASGHRDMLQKWEGVYQSSTGPLGVMLPEGVQAEFLAVARTDSRAYRASLRSAADGQLVELRMTPGQALTNVRVSFPPGYAGLGRLSAFYYGNEMRLMLPLDSVMALPSPGLDKLQVTVPPNLKIEFYPIDGVDVESSTDVIHIDLSGFKKCTVQLGDGRGNPALGAIFEVHEHGNYLSDYPRLRGAKPTTNPMWGERKAVAYAPVYADAHGTARVWLRPGAHRYSAYPPLAGGELSGGGMPASRGEFFLEQGQLIVSLQSLRAHWVTLEVVRSDGTPQALATIRIEDGEVRALQEIRIEGGRWAGAIDSRAAYFSVRTPDGQVGSKALQDGQNQYQIVLD